MKDCLHITCPDIQSKLENWTSDENKVQQILKVVQNCPTIREEHVQH